MNNNGTDFIRDVHGHADELLLLLMKLGYEKNGTSYAHPEGHKVVFLGDSCEVVGRPC